MKKKSFVYAQTTVEGYHRYPEAATDPSLATGDEYDVSHLANTHMHYFFIKVWVEVKHSNRDIEFIQLRRWLNNLFSDNGTLDLNNKSCEMIAENINSEIEKIRPKHDVIVDVSEDGINGAYLEFKEKS